MNEQMNEGNPTPAASPVVGEIPRLSQPGAPTAELERLGAAAIPRLNLALFLLTALTTTMAGAYMAGADLSLFHPILSLVGLAHGLSFSAPLMAILLVHEMGHFLTARRNRVEASYPYFIPAPFPSVFIIGTFGAFIRMKSPPRTRRVMFDVGAAGPWAGLLLAIPTVIIGLKLSQITPLDRSAGGLELGNSILFYGLARWVLGVDPNSVMVNLHPVAFAGWLGLFVTALNLLPVGQLDGGHVTYALFGRWHRLISLLAVAACVLMVAVPWVVGWPYWAGWIVWAVLLLFLGLGHPLALDQHTALDPARRLGAWLSIGLFAVTFIPVPIWFTPPSGPVEPSQVYEVIQRRPAPAPAYRWSL